MTFYRNIDDRNDILDHVEMEERFNEALDECWEPFRINGIEYLPSEVLPQVDPIAYQCGLVDYASNATFEEVERVCVAESARGFVGQLLHMIQAVMTDDEVESACDCMDMTRDEIAAILEAGDEDGTIALDLIRCIEEVTDYVWDGDDVFHWVAV